MLIVISLLLLFNITSVKFTHVVVGNSSLLKWLLCSISLYKYSIFCLFFYQLICSSCFQPLAMMNILTIMIKKSSSQDIATMYEVSLYKLYAQGHKNTIRRTAKGPFWACRWGLKPIPESTCQVVRPGGWGWKELLCLSGKRGTLRWLIDWLIDWLDA